MVAEKTGALAMLAAIVIVCCVVFIDSHLHDAGIATLAKEVSKLEERVAILEGSDISFPIQAQRVADGDQRRRSLRKNDKYIEGEDDDGGDDDDDDDDDDAVSDFMKDMGYEYYNYKFDDTVREKAGITKKGDDNSGDDNSFWSFFGHNDDSDDIVIQKPRYPLHYPTPSPTEWNAVRAYKIQWRTERIVDIQFDMTLCGCPCSAFEDNAGMMVSSDGIFRSRGERALAFAIAANVQGISAATSIQDPASISIPSSTTNSRKDSGEADSSLPSNECNTQVRVSMQAPLDKINILDETGNGIGSNSPEISEFYEEVQMELGYAVDTGNLKRFLLELDFPIVEVCSAPNEWALDVKSVRVGTNLKPKKEFARCKDMITATGWGGLDPKCRREGIGILLLIFTCTLMTFCVCVRLLTACQCGRGPDKGVSPSKALQRGTINALHFEQITKYDEMDDIDDLHLFAGYTKPKARAVREDRAPNENGPW